MDELILPIVVALAVGCLIWAVIRMLPSGEKRQRRKLVERLSTEGRVDISSDPIARSIRRTVEVQGVPPFLAHRAFIQSIHRQLLQAYPNVSLTQFLGLAIGLGLFAGAVGVLLSTTLMGGVPAAAVGLYLPFFFLSAKRNKRQRDLGTAPRSAGLPLPRPQSRPQLQHGLADDGRRASQAAMRRDPPLL